MQEITSDIAIAHIQSLPKKPWPDDPAWMSQLQDQEQQVYLLARHLFERIGLQNPVDFLHGVFFRSESAKDRDFPCFSSGIRPNDCVADIGCGWGGLTCRLGTFVQNVISVDHIFEHAVACKLRNPQARVFHGDARYLSQLRDGMVDFTIFNDVLEHIGDHSVPRGASGHNLREQLRVLRELSRITRDQGAVYIATGNYLFPYDGETNLWFYHWLPPEEQLHFNLESGISADDYWLLVWEDLNRLLLASDLAVETVTSPHTDRWDEQFLDRLEVCFHGLHPEMKKIWRRLITTDPRFFSSWRILARKTKTGEIPPPSQNDFLPLSGTARTSLMQFSLPEDAVIPHPLKRIMEHIGKRRIWIWGAGMGGSRILALLKRAAIPVCGFIDNDPQKSGLRFYDLPVCCPDEILKQQQENCYVFIGSIHSSAIEKRLTEWGYHYWTDYLPLNPAF